MKKNQQKPVLIVLTPVLNEAWILPAFLKATSLWADYIIVADQMSTDGSRDIYKQYPKCIVIDNPRQEMHQAQTRKLLFEEAKKIEGDKIIFTIDADEFLSGDFVHSNGWHTIMNSEPGDMFLFRYMTLSSEGDKYMPWEPYCWATHMNDEVMNGIYPDNFIHEWRLPWPKHENHVYTIDDICFIHFRNINVARQKNKSRYYQVLQYTHPSNKRGGVQFHRQYNALDEGQYYPMPADAYAFYESHNLDIWKEMSLTDEGDHYTQVVLNKLNEVGTKALRKLDIWDKDFCEKHHIQDPRRPIDKLMHWYLRKTNDKSKVFIIHALDYLLKRIY